ncbi:protein OS-9 [Lingula anatina]|uniref:Protein OS-9 n=1 Tax=Lingula anatina TaxID=7574 RepID=A0A1S3IST1_LINAN|nr:protein OS-9 [Lingula anatina]|eukprot:XP_013401270.1 protein OS-9 [Lingula anatina]
MATKTLAAAALFTSFILPLSGGFLNIEELKTINYGIQILNIPVKVGQAADGDVMVLSSKHGQQYQCSFPDHSQQEKQKEEEEKIAIETGIPELLRPLENSPCLVYRKDWWTYEFCYGKFIKQYHMEDGKPVGIEIFLGHYESEFDWNNETIKKDAKNRLNRYHSQQYVNGSNCDLTGVPRRSEVRFLCDEGTGDHVVSVHEPQTCVYTIVVHTNKICHHPYLRSPSSQKPLPITCNPLLTDEQYSEYTQEQEKQRKAEELKHILALQMAEKKKQKLEEEMERMEKLQQDASEDAEKTDPPPVTEDQNTLQPKLRKILTDVLTKKFEKQFGIGSQVPELREIKDMADFQQFVSEYFGIQNKADTSGQAQKVDSPVKDEEKEDESDNQERQITSDNQINHDLNKEIGKGNEAVVDGQQSKQSGTDAQVLDQDIPEPQPSSEQGKPSETPGGQNVNSESEDDISGEMDEETQKFYKNLMKVINKANKNMKKGGKSEKGEVEEEEEDPDATEEQFTKGLEDLGLGADDMAWVANRKEDIRKAMSAQFNDIVDEAERELAGEGEDVQGLDRDVAIQSLSTTLTKLLKRLDDQPPEETDKLETPESAVKSKDRQSKGEDRWRVKVTSGKRKPQDSALDPVTQKLQSGIQEQLQKAGFDTGGRKIEVKIITTGYYNADDDSIHMLSDDDSKAINKMVIAILGTDTDAVDEAEKHSQLEDNYQFVYGKQTKKTSKNKDDSINDLLYYR